jgi:tetratricopeptide (TPR) repeat protein
MYSLGIVLFHLLAGRLPYTGDEPFAIAMQHLQGEIPLLPESLAVCQSVIHSLLRSSADERATAEDLKLNLDRLLLLPELDKLQSPIQLTLEEVEEPEGGEEVTASEDSSRLEQLMGESDVAARIEKRLKERAAALQLSAQGKGNDRADSARMAAINRQDGQVSKTMNRRGYQQKSTRSRFLLLTLLGIAIGAVLYLLIYEPSPTGQPPAGVGVPVDLAAALEAGRLQLQADDSAAAEQAFVALIEEFPGYPQPYNNLAVVYASQGNLDRARIALEQALATDESYSTVYRNLGTVYAEMARDSYGRALQLKKGRQAVSLQLFAADGPLPLPLDKLSSEPVASTAADSEVAAVTAPEQQGEVVQPVEEAAQTESSEPATPQAAAVPPALQKEVATVVLKPEPETAELFLQRWAAAWSAQDVETYLAFYADSFVPSNGRSRQQWEKNRQLRLTRPKTIEISLENFSMVRMRDDKMQLEVTQSYRSDRYADRTRKLFDLQHKGDRWAILRERSLGRVR